MNPTPPQSKAPGDSDAALELNTSVGSLDVHTHERLAFTEPAQPGPPPPPVSKRMAALLKAMELWVRSRF